MKDCNNLPVFDALRVDTWSFFTKKANDWVIDQTWSFCCKVFNVLPFKRCRLWRFYSSRRGREMVFDWHIRAKGALLHYYKQKEIHETLSLPYRNYETLVDAYAASLVLHKLISHNALSRTYKMSKVYIAELEWMVFANHLFITRVKGLHEILNLTLLVHSCYNSLHG